MRSKISIFVAGMAVMALVVAMAGTAAAAIAKKTVLADDVHVEILVDGVVLKPTDVNGKSVEPLVVDGTTYVPVRAVADAFGYDVSWNQETRTVSLDSNEVYTICYGALAVPALENVLDKAVFQSSQQSNGNITYLYNAAELPAGNFVGEYAVLLGEYGFSFESTVVQDGISMDLYYNEFSGMTVSLYYDGGGDYFCVDIQLGSIK